jgi:hypothetical protein
VRYGFEERIVALECGEANGWPGRSKENDGCSSVFVQHNWYRKEDMRQIIANALAAGIVTRIHEYFLTERKQVFKEFGDEY